MTLKSKDLESLNFRGPFKTSLATPRVLASNQVPTPLSFHPLILLEEIIALCVCTKWESCLSALLLYWVMCDRHTLKGYIWGWRMSCTLNI